jgi:hypothetical protein
LAAPNGGPALAGNAKRREAKRQEQAIFLPAALPVLHGWRVLSHFSCSLYFHFGRIYPDLPGFSVVFGALAGPGQKEEG